MAPRSLLNAGSATKGMVSIVRPYAAGDNHEEDREYHQQAPQRSKQEYSKQENRINEMYDDRAMVCCKETL